MRPGVLHPVRDTRRNGREVRRLSRTGLLLTGKGREWWESYFDSRYLREYSPLFDEASDRHFIARLLEQLGLPAGARVLDCPCGQGRHARLLVEAGYSVDAVDLSADMLRAARRSSGRGGASCKRADMRSLPRGWTRRFDAVVNLYSSFGFFDDPADDVLALSEFGRVLRKGGTLALHVGNRDVVPTRMPSRDWWRSDDGTVVAQERAFDPVTGFLSIRTTLQKAAVTEERQHRIRLYNATRLAELMATCGMLLDQVLDGNSFRPLRRNSTMLLVLARKN